MAVPKRKMSRSNTRHRRARWRAVLARSSFIPAAEVAEMLRLRPGTRAVSIPGTGHDVHLEAPDALYGVLSGYLAEAAR